MCFLIISHIFPVNTISLKCLDANPFRDLTLWSKVKGHGHAGLTENACVSLDIWRSVSGNVLRFGANFLLNSKRSLVLEVHVTDLLLLFQMPNDLYWKKSVYTEYFIFTVCCLYIHLFFKEHFILYLTFLYKNTNTPVWCLCFVSLCTETSGNKTSEFWICFRFVPFLWTRYLKNNFREFLKIWCKRSV